MNLTAQEYFNLVDQVTKLKIENQRYQREKHAFADQSSKENIVPARPSSPYSYTLMPKNDSRITPSQQKIRTSKTANDYAEEFKSSINSMQSNICQFISMSTTEQMNYLREEIRKIKDQIKESVEGNKQNAELLKTKSEQEEKSAPTEAQEFYDKVKYIFDLCKKDKAAPSIDQLEDWINKVNTQAIKKQYNPIKSIQQVKSQNKQKESQKCLAQVRKDSLKKIKNEDSERNTIQTYIRQYQNTSKKREASQPIIQSTKSINEQAQDHEQHSFMKPKMKQFKPNKHKQTSNLPVEKSKLKKKSIAAKKDLMTRSGDLKIVKQEKAGKTSTSERKANAKAESTNKKNKQSKKQIIIPKETQDALATQKQKKYGLSAVKSSTKLVKQSSKFIEAEKQKQKIVKNSSASKIKNSLKSSQSLKPQEKKTSKKSQIKKQQSKKKIQTDNLQKKSQTIQRKSKTIDREKKQSLKKIEKTESKKILENVLKEGKAQRLKEEASKEKKQQIEQKRMKQWTVKQRRGAEEGRKIQESRVSLNPIKQSKILNSMLKFQSKKRLEQIKSAPKKTALSATKQSHKQNERKGLPDQMTTNVSKLISNKEGAKPKKSGSKSKI